MKNFNQYITEKIKLSDDRFKNQHNEFEYVDLDLPSGTLWATCNLGAKEPFAAGNFYAWGEIKPKTEEYDWDSYKFGNKRTLNKYTDDDKLDTLKPEDDAAYVELGREYSVPSYNQVYELIKNTIATRFYTDNDINCIELKSIFNDKSIVFPLTGYYSPADAVNPKRLCFKNSGTLLWASCLSNTTDLHAVAFYIDFYKNTPHITYKDRCNGFQIRPVKNK
jgi:hypothetical protein